MAFSWKIDEPENRRHPRRPAYRQQWWLGLLVMGLLVGGILLVALLIAALQAVPACACFGAI